MGSAKSTCISLKEAGLIRAKDIPKIFKMLRALSDICYEELFKGKPVVMPGFLGTLRIYKELPKDPQRIGFHHKHFMPGHEFDANRRYYNPKTGGYIYSFRITGMDCEKIGIKVRMAQKFRLRLFDELYNKDLANTL